MVFWKELSALSFDRSSRKRMVLESVIELTDGYFFILTVLRALLLPLTFSPQNLPIRKFIHVYHKTEYGLTSSPPMTTGS